MQMEPMCKTFLCFYLAICYEFLGRAAHLYSRNKVALLQQALDSFLDCDAALPKLIPLPKLPTLPGSLEFSSYHTRPETPRQSNEYTPEDFLIWIDTPEQASPEHPALIRSMTQMIDLSLSNPDDDPFISDSESEHATSFTLTLPKLRAAPAHTIDKENMLLSPPKTPLQSIDPTKKYRLMPSPLRIHKPDRTESCITVCEDDEDDASGGELHLSPLSKPLPLQATSENRFSIMAHSRVTATTPPLTTSPPCKSSTPSSVYSRDADDHRKVAVDITPARAAKLVRFNRGVGFLREQVSTNITEIQQHLDQVKEIQRVRRSRHSQRATSFWSFQPTTEKISEEDNENEEPEPFMDQFGNILYKETKQQRTVRLRADGWSTVGVRSANSTWKGTRYYQEFCSMVLAELSLDN